MSNSAQYEGRPFGRQIEVLVYPVNELSARKLNLNKNSALRLYSDGTQQTLRISFHVEQNILRIPGYAQIKVYNLKQETRQAISTPGAYRIEMNVGTETLGMQELYSGAIIAGETVKNGPDIITTLWCHSNYIERMTSFITTTYYVGKPVKEILKECADNMQLKWDESRINIDATMKLPQGGFTFPGQTQELLTKLAFQFGFSWTIINDCLQVIQDGNTLPRGHLISYKNNVLLSAFPSLEGVMKVMYAIKVKAYLNPLIWAGDRIQLESLVNSKLNGSHLCFSINFDGSTFDDMWVMDMDLKLLNPGAQEWIGI